MRRRHRTWSQRLLISFNIFMVLLCLVMSAGLYYAFEKASAIGRVDLGSALAPPPAGGSNEPQNFLVIGIDSAEGLDPNDPVNIGRPGGIRSDTIMVLRIDPSSEKASILSLPRDLFVPIAGTNGSTRINEAIEGGPQRLVETISNDFGIAISHYLEIDFRGFRDLVGAVDGVPLYFPDPVRDLHSGLDVPDPGCITLDGVQALAFARARAYEVKHNGRWQTDPTGDLGRIERQQLFIRKVLQRAIDRGARNPAVLNELINAATGAIHVDSTLSTSDIIDLALRFKDFNPSTLDTLSLPATPITVHGADVLKLDKVAAEPILNQFRDVKSQLSPNSSILLSVQNGSGAPGQAEQAAAGLHKAGFAVEEGTEDADHFGYAYTTVLWAADQEAHAELVASYIPGAVVVPSLYVPSGLLVITGENFQGVLDQPAASATTTTEAPTSTTTSTVVPGSTSSSTSTSTTLGAVPETPQDVHC
jgi:LCP family protein required for cell wall assembly